MTTLLFNKPYGVVSAFTDDEPGDDRRTLKDFISVPGVYPAGRLDRDSEGLLLITDDGDLIHRLTHPRHDFPKTYLVQVEGVVTTAAVERLRHGVPVKGEPTKPASVQIVPEPDLPPRPKPVRGYHPTTWLKIVLREGKKRQIRHMTAAVGFPTLRLVRVAIGTLTLDGLQPGQWRRLTLSEARALAERGATPRGAAPDRRAGRRGTLPRAPGTVTGGHADRRGTPPHAHGAVTGDRAGRRGTLRGARGAVTGGRAGRRGTLPRARKAKTHEL